VRVLLDSNVWLAILTTDGFCREMWRRARRICNFSASQYILDEVEEKLRTKFGFSNRHAHLMTLFVKRQTEIVRVASAIMICRDSDDNRVLAAALDSACSHLITGDSDLLVLRHFEDVAIVTPRQFMESVHVE
jgi:putative PIN family toxin of toxin-antitoxin system